MKVTGFLGALALAASIASSGSAQEVDTQTQTQTQVQTAEAQTQDYRDKAARGLFEAGSVAFEEGRFEEALNHFSKAYELSPNRHLLLYNIGSSLDRLRRDKEALSNFEKYLELNPTAPNRPAVEARVRLLREAVAKQEQEEAEEKRRREEDEARRAQAEQAQADANVQVAVDAPQGRRKLSPIYTYVGAGLTVALGGLTVWSGLNTLSANDDYEKWAKKASPSDANFRSGKDLYEDGVKRQNRTNLLIGATGTVAIATAVVAIFFTDWKGDAEDETAQAPKVQAFASPEGAGMELRHAF